MRSETTGQANGLVRADDGLVQELETRFRESCTHEAIEAAEREWPAQLWQSLQDDGFTEVGVPEELGGSGGSVVDACAVLRAAGKYAAPVPLAESGLLSGWAAGVLGTELPEGLTTIAAAPEVLLSGSSLSGRVEGVPWARAADHLVLVLDGGAVVVVPREDVGVEEGANLAGEPRDAVVLDGVAPVATATGTDEDRERFLRLGALSRVALSAGALERLVDLSVEYTAQRKQFGRPVGRFQAVQAHLVALAEISAMATVAAEVAAAAVDGGGGRYEVACAKSVTSAQAAAATRAAHQAHGAMGMTREYPLHHYSRRLWSWSTEYGDARAWNAVLGTVVRTLSADSLYPFITDPALAG
jgi:acyl-CoA dehydrogenase